METNNATVTLKSFKHIKSLSQETICFTATVLLNGSVIGHAENRGRGGCTFIRPTDNTVDVSAYVEEVDRLVDELVNAAEDAKLRRKVQKDLGAMVMFRLVGDKVGTYRVLKQKFSSSEDTHNAANILKGRRADIECVFNLMPFDEAYSLLVRNA